jgi:hypothetical protein
MSLKKKFLLLSGLAALAAVPAMSSPLHTFGPFSHYLNIDFDAQSTSAGHVNWSTWTPPGSTPGTRYVDLTLNAKLSGEGQCYEFRIEASSAVANPDLQLWTADGRSIDDDGPNLDRKPNAKMWITSPYKVRVSAYSTGSNSVDFGISNFCYIATTSAQCDDGIRPFYNQATNSIVRANSLAN